MGVYKETIVSYGVKIHYDEIIKFLKERQIEDVEEYWYDELETTFDEFGVDMGEFSDGPTDDDDNMYVGIIHDMDDNKGKTFVINEEDLKQKYDKVFTDEIKEKFYPLFENKKEELLTRVVWR